jgi:hypothetical protein
MGVPFTVNEPRIATAPVDFVKTKLFESPTTPNVTVSDKNVVVLRSLSTLKRSTEPVVTVRSSVIVVAPLDTTLNPPIVNDDGVNAPPDIPPVAVMLPVVEILPADNAPVVEKLPDVKVPPTVRSPENEPSPSGVKDVLVVVLERNDKVLVEVNVVAPNSVLVAYRSPEIRLGIIYISFAF